MKVVKKTESICPVCRAKIPATVYEESGKVYIAKTCPDHGEFNEVYWDSYSEYERAARYKNYFSSKESGCPYDCGICPNHRSTPMIGIIDVTNRCNLRCPICFAHAGAAGYVYEPTLDQIESMMLNLIDTKPFSTPCLQLSGGEPTVRDDLPEMIRVAKELGFILVMVNSNGIRMAESLDYCRELKEADLDNVYLQFDGVTPEPYIQARGLNLLPVKLKAIENLKEAGLASTVLVPTLVKGVNDDQIGDIIRFAIDNNDCVRGVNFQPVSITGRINASDREKMRITIPELTRLAEEQTGGFIKQRDWYPIPAVQPLTQLISHVKNRHYPDFNAHPHCGAATYLVVDGDEVHPITEYMDVDRLIESLESYNKGQRDGHDLKTKVDLAKTLLKGVEFGGLFKMIRDIVYDNDFQHVFDIHREMILLSTMHFQDPYNFDVDRVQRCVVHYATPDDRVIPFCAMNNIHREEVERKFAIDIDQGLTEIVPRFTEENLGEIPSMATSKLNVERLIRLNHPWVHSTHQMPKTFRE